MSSKVHILTLGCPRNLVDSQAIANALKKKSVRFVDNIKDAEILIINSCAFIEEAKEESIGFILDAIELKKKGSLKKILVYGCLVQRYSKELIKEFKEVDAFMGRIGLEGIYGDTLLTPFHYAYLKICEGCFNHCSFCVIPKIKGKFISRNEEDILNEARILDEKNVKELNIIGQDITCYGLDKNDNLGLLRLIRRILSETKNIRWLRLLYLNPSRISNELLELINNEERICSYIDMPIQHINDRILRLMNRRISKRDIISLLKRIRRKIPNAAIRSAVIVGFPSETDKEFDELLDFMELARFERLGAFIYSREEGTAAYDFSGQIPSALKKKRFDILMSKQQEIAKGVNRKLVGSTMEVIIDEKEKDNIYLARSRFDAPEVDGAVFIKSKDRLRPGDIMRAKISEGYEYDLVGEKAAS
ncbi:MAG: 30S ribosomal protein S12 methylthiotransferase RimO [Candidatus Omnitrophica bacterium CG11_big_fil_rev_8_21_14_0_20_42_13]|uniref:Ribosomal protein uS12 methylthiotransferase RimO n=1 Tax=Candidatus Ghiorseimicrobium undicola TaxID=1974746 RepID=A0A2H0LWN9_9BACT|nr:MAG: 30S ribosomal protein S12 methylthiotransferase RimO [Candidatus Omnitrophica bacterium CG11_big_fil_rev_8_21_14_0_20_42_13]